MRYPALTILCLGLLWGCKGAEHKDNFYKLRTIPSPDNETITAISGLPGGQKILCGTYSGWIYSYDAENGFKRLEKKSRGNPIYQVLPRSRKNRMEYLVGVRDAGLQTMYGDTFAIRASDSLKTNYSPYSSLIVDDTLLFMASSNGVYMFSLSAPDSLIGKCLLYPGGTADDLRFYGVTYSKSQGKLFAAGHKGLWSIDINSRDSIIVDKLSDQTCYTIDTFKDGERALVLFDDGCIRLLNPNAPGKNQLRTIREYDAPARILFHSGEDNPDRSAVIGLGFNSIQVDEHIENPLDENASDNRLPHKRHFADYSEQSRLVCFASPNSLHIISIDKDGKHTSGDHLPILSVCPDFRKGKEGDIYGLGKHKRIYKINVAKTSSGKVPKPKKVGTLRTPGDFVLLGKTKKGLLLKTTPDNRVFVYRMGKAIALKELPTNLLSVSTESASTLIASTSDSVFRFNLVNKKITPIYTGKEAAHSNVQDIFCYAPDSMLLRPLSKNLLHVTGKKIETLGIPGDGFSDLAIAADRGLADFLMKDNRQIHVFNFTANTLDTTTYALPEGFPSLKRIACNTKQLLGIPSNKELGGVVSWELEFKDHTPQLLLAGEVFHDFGQTPDGDIALGTEDGFQSVLAAETGGGGLIPVNALFREQPWGKAISWIVVLLFAAGLGSIATVLIKNKIESKKKNVEAGANHPHAKRAKRPLLKRKKHDRIIAYKPLYKAWKEFALPDTSLEEFQYALDYADFRVIMKRAIDAGPRAGYIGGVKYIMRGLRNDLGNTWYQQACKSINETPNSVNKINDRTGHIGNIDLTILSKHIKKRRSQ